MNFSPGRANLFLPRVRYRWAALESHRLKGGGEELESKQEHEAKKEQRSAGSEDYGLGGDFHGFADSSRWTAVPITEPQIPLREAES